MIIALLKLIFWSILIFVLLFIFSSRFRAGVLLLFIQHLQKKAQRKMNSQQQTYKEENKEQSQKSNRTHAHHEKIDLDDIEAKRFKEAKKDDYVDFEEVK